MAGRSHVARKRLERGDDVNPFVRRRRHETLTENAEQSESTEAERRPTNNYTTSSSQQQPQLPAQNCAVETLVGRADRRVFAVSETVNTPELLASSLRTPRHLPYVLGKHLFFKSTEGTATGRLGTGAGPGAEICGRDRERSRRFSGCVCGDLRVEPGGSSDSGLDEGLNREPAERMNRLSLMVPGGPDRRKQIQDAKDMYQELVRKGEKTGGKPPPYEFLELIGKGTYGRVYKCKKKDTSQLVAVKIIEVDDEDFASPLQDRDDSVNNFRKEVSTLQQLKESKARNINMIHEAFDLHSQLWIVSDYCTGGSVRTLMRAKSLSSPGLEEEFIIPIARELAVAIKCVHDIGVLHRDLKCTNVYITEDGQIQLGDFGIVGVMDDDPSVKRTTIIGTPNYMPKELLEGSFGAEGYGKEVDIWAYGSTVYEMATGLVPYQGEHPGDLPTLLGEKEPRLEGGDYTQGLRDFVAFCLVNEPQLRPSADAILAHPYLANTSKQYPTSSLTALIERYAMWEYRGGQRASLWADGGAVAPPSADPAGKTDNEDDSVDWNFSTSEGFDKGFANRLSQMLTLDDALNFDAPAGSGLPPLITNNLPSLSVEESIRQQHQDRSANRGAKSLNRLFDNQLPSYELHTPVVEPKFQPQLPVPDEESDLVLRREHGSAEPRESVIDLDAINLTDAAPSLAPLRRKHTPSESRESIIDLDFADLDSAGEVRTLKPNHAGRSFLDEDIDDDDPEYTYDTSGDIDEKRATMEWQMPRDNNTMPAPKRATMAWDFSTAQAEASYSDNVTRTARPGQNTGELAPAFRPTLKHTATAPVGDGFDFWNHGHHNVPLSSSPTRDSMASMIDLDAGPLNPEDAVNSTQSDIRRLDLRRPSTANSIADSTATDMTSGNPFDLEDDLEQNENDRDRFSYHKHWRSEGADGSNRGSLRSMPMHSRGASLSDTDSDLDPALRNTNYQQEAPFEFSRKVQEHLRDQAALSLDPEADSMDLDKWPDFGPQDDSPGPSFATQPHTTSVPVLDDPDYPLSEGGPNTNGFSTSRSASLGQRDDGSHRGIIDFPMPVAPHSDALLEDADLSLLAAEFERLLDDMRDGFHATAVAIRAHAGLSSDDEGGGGVTSGTESGTEESSTFNTEDEGGF